MKDGREMKVDERRRTRQSTREVAVGEAIIRQKGNTAAAAELTTKRD